MEEIDLKELFQIFWERKTEIILITIIFMVIGVIYSVGFVTPKYQSRTTLLLATNGSNSTRETTETITTTDVNLNSKLVSTYSTLVKSSKIIRNVISNLAIDTSEASIKKNVSVKTVSDAEVIEITVKNEDPVLAAKITNEIAKVFIENIKEFYGMENIHVVDEAEVTEKPVNVNHLKNIVIFGGIGLVIALLYVLVLNMIDTTVKSEEDLEKVTGLTVLASVPIYETAEDKNKNKRKKGGNK